MQPPLPEVYQYASPPSTAPVRRPIPEFRYKITPPPLDEAVKAPMEVQKTYFDPKHDKRMINNPSLQKQLRTSEEAFKVAKALKTGLGSPDGPSAFDAYSKKNNPRGYMAMAKATKESVGQTASNLKRKFDKDVMNKNVGVDYDSYQSKFYEILKEESPVLYSDLRGYINKIYGPSGSKKLDLDPYQLLVSYSNQVRTERMKDSIHTDVTPQLVKQVLKGKNLNKIIEEYSISAGYTKADLIMNSGPDHYQPKFIVGNMNTYNRIHRSSIYDANTYTDTADHRARESIINEIGKDGFVALNNLIVLANNYLHTKTGAPRLPSNFYEGFNRNNYIRGFNNLVEISSPTNYKDFDPKLKQDAIRMLTLLKMTKLTPEGIHDHKEGLKDTGKKVAKKVLPFIM